MTSVLFSHHNPYLLSSQGDFTLFQHIRENREASEGSCSHPVLCEFRAPAAFLFR